MFKDSGATGTLLLCLTAALIVAALLWWLYREKVRAVQIGLGMIIGGALGNLVARVRVGMIFFGKPSVGRLHLVVGGGGGYA